LKKKKRPGVVLPPPPPTHTHTHRGRVFLFKQLAIQGRAILTWQLAKLDGQDSLLLDASFLGLQTAHLVKQS
jgi:hypothetical protein